MRALSQKARRQKIARLVSRVLVSGSSLSAIDSRRISQRLTRVAIPRTASAAASPRKKEGTMPKPQRTMDEEKTEMPKRTAKIQIRVKTRLSPRPLYARLPDGRLSTRTVLNGPEG